MTNLIVNDQRNKDRVETILNSFDHSGEVFWKKRNTIKIFDIDGQKLNVKSFKVPHLINRFAYRYVRKSKARRSYEHALILLQKGILSPKPIAYLEKSDLLGLTNSFYISENLDYDLNFENLYDENYPDRINILEQFATFTYSLHENEIHHFDHSKGNTLICANENGTYDFYLIDLNRMKFEKMDYQQRIDNFNRLSLTPPMIEIIGRKYASLINMDADKVVNDITASCKKFKDFYIRKGKWKKMIGKDLASGSGQ